ncbi:hypothetical protein WICMUC_001518 [Wickerhamomyces mucosus]|uniref:Glycosyltransferase family 15 protein n=1 Tax=Wickerhamomyces mucosus TaxID=1378264 RepID=A0A9P8THF5_9ASCO|nr:hypothetical protein WICMUC_001518 [Wickerhamomyces mucosus]
MQYIEKVARLKALQILYPEKHYTSTNASNFKSLIDPVTDSINDPNLKFVEFDEEPNYVRENATFFSLVRNEELYSMLESINYVETRFNRRYHYDWIFANDEEFTENFKSEVSNLVSGNTTFVTIPKEYWSYPDFIDQKKASNARMKMKKKGIIYGGSESYRHMCRFNSGFFYRMDCFKGLKYYWRVEPDIKFSCDLNYDYFKYMRENNLKYGWTMALHEIPETVKGLYEATKEYFRDLHPDYIPSNNHIEFITQDNEDSFNMCHYWSNFEIGDLDFLRSKQYTEYFEYLDRKGGFFYERWGDAPIHTLAVSYLLNKDEIHYFDNTGYYHVPHTQCPRDQETRKELHCICQSSIDFNWGSSDSCLAYYYETKEIERPSNVPIRGYTAHRQNNKRENIESIERDYETINNSYRERQVFIE